MGRVPLLAVPMRRGSRSRSREQDRGSPNHLPRRPTAVGAPGDEDSDDLQERRGRAEEEVAAVYRGLAFQMYTMLCTQAFNFGWVIQPGACACSVPSTVWDKG